MPSRWENTTAIGPSRNNFSASVPIADVLWFFLRQSDLDLDDVDITRIQKRLCHLVAQRMELAFVNKEVLARSSPPSTDVAAASTPWDHGSRNSNADILKQELLRRFLARGGGFVSGLQHTSNENLLVEVPGTKNHAVGTVAASQWCAAYFCQANSEVLRRMAQQKYKHVTVYHDAASANTWQAGCLCSFPK